MEKIIAIKGIVIRGDGRGRKLGFPTANIALQQETLEGIYAAHVSVDGKTYQAASFVGAAKTFDKTEAHLESYLLDFDDDLYGKEITVTLYQKIRDNKKFDSVEALIEQMKQDVKEIRALFANQPE